MVDPRTPGMDDETPRAKPVAILIMLGLVAVQVYLRYEQGFLAAKEWQGFHVALGIGLCLAVIVLFHGFGVIRRVKPQTWAILACGVICFLVFWYLGRMDSYRRFFGEDDQNKVGPFVAIRSFLYFSISAFVLRTVVPLIFVRFAFGLRPGDLGLHAGHNPHPPAVRRIWPLYLGLFLLMVPFLIYAAHQGPFLAKYPLAKKIIVDGAIPGLAFVTYQAFYLLIFISGESFWRGFLIFGMERDFGAYALPLMVVPYVTAHFGKPFPETMGAIAAGLTLGWLAWKHRSMWLGVALHYAVALSMDLLSVWGNGYWFDWSGGGG